MVNILKAHGIEPWMKQMARNLTDREDGFLNGKRFLIMDRDTKFTEGFCELSITSFKT